MIQDLTAFLSLQWPVAAVVLLALIAFLWWRVNALHACVDRVREESQAGDTLILDRLDTLDLKMSGRLNEGSTLFRENAERLARLEGRQ